MRLATQANIVIARTKRRMKSINSGKIRVKLFTKGYHSCYALGHYRTLCVQQSILESPHDVIVTSSAHMAGLVTRRSFCATCLVFKHSCVGTCDVTSVWQDDKERVTEWMSRREARPRVASAKEDLPHLLPCQHNIIYRWTFQLT